jgi:hypothetical protein
LRGPAVRNMMGTSSIGFGHMCKAQNSPNSPVPLRSDKGSILGHLAKYFKRSQKRSQTSPKDPISNPELAKYLRQDSLLKAKHPRLEHTMLTASYIAAVTVPCAGSAMTCPHFVRKFWPYVRAMDRLAAAAEVPVDAVDVGDVEDAVAAEDVTRKRNENWRSSGWKMNHLVASWQLCNLVKVQIYPTMRSLSYHPSPQHPPMQEMPLGDVTPCSGVLAPTLDICGGFVTD